MPTANTASPSVTRVIWSCTRNLVLGGLALIAVVAVIAGLVMAIPHVAAAISDGWYRWAHWMTNDYTTVKVPTLVFWGSLVTVLWSACITAKLASLTPAPSITGAFALLAVVALLLGMVPAWCATATTASDWAIAWVMQQDVWTIAGTATYYLGVGAGWLAAFALFCGFMFLLMEAQARA